MSREASIASVPAAAATELGPRARTSAAVGVPDAARLTYLAWVVLVGIYLLRISFHFLGLDEAYRPLIHAIYRGESGILDRCEAVLWIPAVTLNAVMVVMAWRRPLAWLTRLWLLGLTFACFIMAGEEVSWGQHVLGFAPPESVAAVNAQEEFNFHNLNIGLLLGLPTEHWLYPHLTNFNFILNPAYYLFSIIVWIAIPLARARRLHPWLEAIPTPTRRISLFVGATFVAWAFFDKLFFNAGEILEFGLVSSYALATLEIYRRFRATGDPRDGVAPAV